MRRLSRTGRLEGARALASLGECETGANARAVSQRVRHVAKATRRHARLDVLCDGGCSKFSRAMPWPSILLLCVVVMHPVERTVLRFSVLYSMRPSHQIEANGDEIFIFAPVLSGRFLLKMPKMRFEMRLRRAAQSSWQES
jgi:hypothetical protein